MAEETWTVRNDPGAAPTGPAHAVLAPDARRPHGGRVWDILLAVDVALILLSVVMTLVRYLFALGDPVPVGTEPSDGGSSAAELVFLNLSNLLLLGILPFAWAAGTRVRPWEGAVRYLRLDRPWPALAHGVGYAALFVGGVLVVSILIDVFGIQPEVPPDERFRGINWPLAILTSAVAGFAEEVFFRGVLQRFMGVWGQAVVFGLAHIQNGVIAFAVTGTIGLVFGLLVARGRSLWLPISAHFFYDMALLGNEVLSG